MYKFLLILLSLTLIACDGKPWNSPNPIATYQENIRFSSFSSPPKTLDPARSYSAEEIVFIGQIYEPPLQYHFFKRPYTLEPSTAVTMPKVSYLDKNYSPTDNIQDVAYTLYEIEIKPNIFYQPHPAFAKNAQNNYLYHHLSRQQVQKITNLYAMKLGTRELTAEDYVYEIKRLASPLTNSPILGVMDNYIVGLKELTQQLQNSQRNTFLDLRNYPLQGAEVVDRYHYRILIKGKYPQFIYWLAMPFFAPIPWEADLFYSQPGMHEKNLTFDWFPVGTGPYFLVKNNPNREMRLNRNINFHSEFFPSGTTANVSPNQKLPLIDSAIYTLDKEFMPRWNKFLQGYYDNSTISSDSFDQAIQVDKKGEPYLTKPMQEKGIRLITSVSPSIFYMGFNMLDPVVGGTSERARKLRQAISIALDYEEYIGIFLNGRGLVAQGPIPPGIFGYVQGEAGINPIVFLWQNGSPHRKPLSDAQKLLREAGYPNGRDSRTHYPLVLNYDIAISGGPDEKPTLNWMREQFAKLGIQLNIRGTEYNRFQQKMLTGQAQIFSWAWNADYPDPENFLFLLYSKNGKVKFGGENAANYENPEFDRLFETMRNLPNDSSRQTVINQMVNIVRRDAPWVFGFFPKEFVLMQQWNAMHPINDMANNSLKYQSLNPKQRFLLIQKWNKPIFWPLGIVLIALVVLALPVLIRYWQKEIKETVKKPPQQG